MKVAIGSRNPLKKQAVHNAFARVFGEVEVVMHNVNSGVPSQPKGYDVMIGARQRAERSRASISDVDFGVGIESGLLDVFGVELDVQVCSIFEEHGTRSAPLQGSPIRPQCLTKLQQGEKSAI